VAKFAQRSIRRAPHRADATTTSGGIERIKSQLAVRTGWAPPFALWRRIVDLGAAASSDVV
jgi:hypothetical protein